MVVKVVAAVMDGHKYKLTTALQSQVEINSKKPPGYIKQDSRQCQVWTGSRDKVPEHDGAAKSSFAVSFLKLGSLQAGPSKAVTPPARATSTALSLLGQTDPRTGQCLRLHFPMSV